MTIDARYEQLELFPRRYKVVRNPNVGVGGWLLMDAESGIPVTPTPFNSREHAHHFIEAITGLLPGQVADLRRRWQKEGPQCLVS